MIDLGRRLREARERAGLSVADVSARTKISLGALNAMERGDFGRLPGDFYTRAFLKNYAKEVHLPVQDVIKEYDDLVEPPQPVIAPGSVSPRPAAQPHVDAAAAAARGRPWHQRIEPVVIRLPRDANFWAGGVLILLVVVAAALALRPANRTPSERAGVATSGVAQAAPAPAATSGHTPPRRPEKLTIDIRPSAPIWVAATADGNSVIYRLLQPGEHVVVDAQRELSFRIGNAGAFVYAINGVPGKSLGGPDEVREFEITRDNYLSYRR